MAIRTYSAPLSFGLRMLQEPFPRARARGQGSYAWRRLFNFGRRRGGQRTPKNDVVP